MGIKTKGAASDAAKSSKALGAVKRVGENGFTYKAQYGLVITCADEAEQRGRFEWLQGLGIKAKVVCV